MSNPAKEEQVVPETAAAAAAERKPKKVRAGKVPALAKKDFSYTFCYCEENVYKLLERLTLMQAVDKAKGTESVASQFDLMYAMFLSSFTKERKTEELNQWVSLVPLRVSPGDKDDVMCLYGKRDCCVTWDYHVVALLRSTDKKLWFVADFDTRFPTKPNGESLLIPADEYFGKAFVFKDLANLDLAPNAPRPTMLNVKMLASRFESVKARLVPATTLLTYFRSDRSHMLDKKGAFSDEPPKYPAIDGPSPMAQKLRPAGSEPVKPYKPELSNLLVCYLNVAEQRDPSLAEYLGDVVEVKDLPAWLDSRP